MQCAKRLHLAHDECRFKKMRHDPRHKGNANLVIAHGRDVGLINGGPGSSLVQEPPDPRHTESAGTGDEVAFYSRSNERPAACSQPNATM